MKTPTRLPLIFLGFISTCFSCSQCNQKPPSVKTEEVTGISDNSAKVTGTIIDDGNATVTKQGFYFSTSQNSDVSGIELPNVTEGPTNFSAVISELDATTKYYIKAYAVNSAGTGLGNEVSFSTTNVKDVDGNVYNTVKIGTQTWMSENLKVTKYLDGSAIQNVTDNNSWLALMTGAYCWYNNDATTNKDLYGALYNWYTVTDSRKICPSGWHVPTDSEWTTLINFLGGPTTAGGKLKEVGTTHWLSPNTGADNSSGFTGLPAGYRYGGILGTFYQINRYADWWASDIAHYRGIYCDNTNVTGNETLSPGTYGFSVRCIKD